MIDVEVFGAPAAPGVPGPEEIERLCVTVADRLGAPDGHVAVEFVGEQRIAQLNREHRGKPEPTDVLSFPIDGVHETPPDATGAAGQGELAAVAPRELGDIVICPEHTADLREAVVHGMLHLLGMDHETDSGEMLALQRELLVHGAQ
jgi:probable rRNA maturation factor